MDPLERAKEVYLRGCLDKAQREGESNFEAFTAFCESPIEKLLMGAMLAQWSAGPHCFGHVDREGNQRALRTLSAIKDMCDPGKYPSGFTGYYTEERYADCTLITQMPVRVDGRGMVLDFAILAEVANGPHAWIAIECDGHDFHERTKAQAASDRSRDRLLTVSGWTVIRFTGSEIHRNPPGCVNEIDRVVAAVLLSLGLGGKKS